MVHFSMLINVLTLQLKTTDKNKFLYPKGNMVKDIFTQIICSLWMCMCVCVCLWGRGGRKWNISICLYWMSRHRTVYILQWSFSNHFANWATIRNNSDCSSHRAQSHFVQLPPDFNCSDCTIRLMRQAEEWGKSYRFWTCADVDIHSSK